MNDLRQLLRDNVAEAPADQLDLAAVVGAGRRRVRTRRRAVVAGVSLTVAAAAVTTVVAWPGAGPGTRTADHPPTPEAPVLRLSDAEPAVAGRDYRVLASVTDAALAGDAGRSLDGVTDDGLILFRDGSGAGRTTPRMALMDPATGEKDWLPDLDAGRLQTWPVELGADRLVLLGAGEGLEVRPRLFVLDRTTREWSTVTWPGLPAASVRGAVVGPDDRLYVKVPVTAAPDRGGDTYELWSAALDDPTDVRDEGLRLGEVAFTDSSMVWTDGTNGDAGLVHVRDLASGDERAFDPRSGERCSLQSLGAADDRLVLGQYCGTYAGGERDDRAQILTTDGDQVVTIQGDGPSAWLPPGSDVVNLTVFGGGASYVYDLATDRFLRVSTSTSNSSLGGPIGHERQFEWDTSVDGGQSATQWLAELR